jgi:hypothetical protein
MMPKLLLRSLEVRHVTSFEQQVKNLAVAIADRLDRDVDVGSRDPFPIEPDLLVEDLARRSGSYGALHQRNLLRVKIEGRAFPYLAAEALAGGRCAPACLLPVQLDDRTVRLHQHQDFKDRVEDGAEACLAQRQFARPFTDLAAQFELRLLGKRDVACHADEAT